jgi:hypothetical protein
MGHRNGTFFGAALMQQLEDATVPLAEIVYSSPLEAAPIGEYRMCQGEAEGLPNSSEHCRVQKVASLLAQAIS